MKKVTDPNTSSILLPLLSTGISPSLCLRTVSALNFLKVSFSFSGRLLTQAKKQGGNAFGGRFNEKKENIHLSIGKVDYETGEIL
jgi:hypothetical protein